MDDVTEGYKCTFITKPQEHFYCQGCKYVAKESTITTCCGRTFCERCINKVREKGHPCPHCGKDIGQTVPQLWYRETITTLRVECLKKNRGCDWEGMLKDLDAHLNEIQGTCMFTEVFCPKNCGVKVERKYIEAHQNNVCAERDFLCQYCNKRGTYKSISTEHWSECAYKPVSCPNTCGVTCEQNLLEEHLKKCSLATIHCTYQKVGCTAELRRQDEDAHLESNTQIHLNLTMTMCQKLKEELEATKSRYERGLQEQAQSYTERLQAIEKQQAEAYKLHEENLNAMYKNYEHKFKTMRCNFEMVLREKDESMRLMREKMNSLIDSRVEQKIESFKQKTGILPYNFTLTEFHKFKQENELWYGPEMLTHSKGYTFLITVRANGFGDYKDKSVGVWLRSLKGQYDYDLKWPVKVIITLQLLNRHHDQNHMTIRKPFQLTRSESGHAYVGEFSPDFIPHCKLGYNVLQKTQYLKDDCLKFRVTSIIVERK